MVRFAFFLIILTLFLISSASSATDRTDTKMNSSYPITIQIAGSPVIASEVVTGENMSWGRLAMASNNLSNLFQGNPRCTIENLGYATVDFTVEAEVSGGWTLGTALADVGVDRCVIAGIFTAPVLEGEMPAPDGRNLVIQDFADDDVLNGTAIQATTNVLARNNTNPDPDDPEWLKGYDVVSGMPYSMRSMRFLFQAPTIDTTDIPHTLTITFSIVIH